MGKGPGGGDVSDDLVKGDDFMAGELLSTLLLHLLFANSVSLTYTTQARPET
jgi:hypothetical protein